MKPGTCRVVKIRTTITMITHGLTCGNMASPKVYVDVVVDDVKDLLWTYTPISWLINAESKIIREISLYKI